jgi:hypothetical protein
MREFGLQDTWESLTSTISTLSSLLIALFSQKTHRHIAAVIKQMLIASGIDEVVADSGIEY